LYCAARIAYGRPPPWIDLDNREASLSSLTRDPVFWTSIGFGLALGLAASCKLTALALAVVLPAALTLRLLNFHCQFGGRSRGGRSSKAGPSCLTAIYLLAAGLAALVTFRICQPYAFVGLLPNTQWLSNLREQYAQASGAADLPWNLQWARRTH